MGEKSRGVSIKLWLPRPGEVVGFCDEIAAFDGLVVT